MPHSHRRYRSCQYLFHSYTDGLVGLGSFRRWGRRYLLGVSLRHFFSARLERLGRFCFPRGETFPRRYCLRAPGFFPQVSETSIWRRGRGRGRRPGMRRTANDRFAPAPHAIERYWRFPPARGKGPVLWSLAHPLSFANCKSAALRVSKASREENSSWSISWAMVSSMFHPPLKSDARTDVL